MLDSSPLFTSFGNNELALFHLLNVNNFLLLYHFELLNLIIFDLLQSIAIFVLTEVHIVPFLAGEILFKLPEFF